MTDDGRREAAAVAAIEETFGPTAPRLLRVFATTAARDLAAARENAAAGRTEPMSRAAHSLKGAAAVLGLGDIADLADRVQHADAADAAPLIEDLEAAVAAIVDAIRRRGHPLDPPAP
jgi:HPt (histidine-containing phosphotransfer) domain-containing protein